MVPRQAVFSLAGKRVVYRQSGGDFEAVDVEVGSSGLGWLTLKGDPLAVGDRVALRDPRRNLEEVARGSSASTSGVAVTPAKAGS